MSRVYQASVEDDFYYGKPEQWEFPTWEDLAKCPYDAAEKALKSYNEENDSPWPINPHKSEDRDRMIVEVRCKDDPITVRRYEVVVEVQLGYSAYDVSEHDNRG